MPAHPGPVKEEPAPKSPPPAEAAPAAAPDKAAERKRKAESQWPATFAGRKCPNTAKGALMWRTLRSIFYVESSLTTDCAARSLWRAVQKEAGQREVLKEEIEVWARIHLERLGLAQH